MEINNNYGWTASTFAMFRGSMELAILLGAKPEKARELYTNSSTNEGLTRTTRSGSREHKSKDWNGLFTKVTFQVKSPALPVGQFIAIVGSRKALGSWSFEHSLPMTLLKKESENELIWTVSVSLPSGLYTDYMYTIQEGYRPVLWEDFPEPRSVFPPKSLEFSVNDGNFGLSPISQDVSLIKGKKKQLEKERVTLFLFSF